MKYTFIDQHVMEFRVVSMCRALKVHRSGYYAWKAAPLSARAIEDAKFLVEIKQSYADSQGIYGSPRVHRDLREAGFKCGEKRVARLMREAKLKSVRGYRCPRYKSGKPAIASPNHLQQNSRSAGQMKCGSPTSRKSALTKVGCMWLSSWTCIQERWWVGQ